MTPQDQCACPACGHRRSRVYDVRREPGAQDSVLSIRRRECLACQTRFRTRSVERVIAVMRPYRRSATDSTA